MSHSIYIDESNGNNLYNLTSQATNSTYRPQNLNSSTSPKTTTRTSNEDLSQSLSEYTDAEESMSAPTEFLAEFLSAVMLKDYTRALEYCKLILQYEPNNATAKEFYPLIEEKLRIDSTTENEENYNKLSDECVDSENDDADDVEEEEEESENSSNSSSSEEESSNESEATSEESDENILDAPGSNNSSSVGGSGISRSDNTTHSYSSLLLEEDDDVPQNLNLRDIQQRDLDIANGNCRPASCSDSESPTEPLTQRLAAILRSKCNGPTSKNTINKK